MTFTRFFLQATGFEPYPYQKRLAEEPSLPEVLSVPTGLGKTAAVVLAWVWRRYQADGGIRNGTPRRLVYCLPTRVLVKQVVGAIESWLERLELPGEPSGGRLRVVPLMGGETATPQDRDSWLIDPADGLILVGTQDMLLSRALNRGYAMSRFAWPIPFALLNNDALWVVDETQLMGPGLYTTAQLAGLRRKLGVDRPVGCLWMSATMDACKLDTFDNADGKSVDALSAEDLVNPEVRKRSTAHKVCAGALTPEGTPIALGSPSYPADLASFIGHVHKPSTLTIAVLNTVGRCQEVFRRLRGGGVPVSLIHSGFRGRERDRLEDLMTQPAGETGRILVSTQVIEAGVDISSCTLVTESAPWSSLVQRIGRCNRYGEHVEASVFWTHPSGQESDHLPYDHQEVLDGIRLLAGIHDASPDVLSAVSAARRAEAPPLLRRKDLVELFDTTPDLLGFDLDVARFIRELDEPDVHVCWRDLPEDRPAPTTHDASAEELCRVSLRQFALFLKKSSKSAFTWDHLNGRWAFAYPGALIPGRIYMLDASAGGYSDELGWTGSPKDRPTPTEGIAVPDQQGSDYASEVVSRPVPLTEHSFHAASELERLAPLIGHDILHVLRRAAMVHDAGKAHPVFQAAAGRTGGQPVAKAPAIEPYSRRGFRHELASALLALQNGEAPLLCYLVAAHHGKVRMSLRSHRSEASPADPATRHARGVFDGDVMPEVVLPEGIVFPETVLDLSPIEMGSAGDKPSWRQITEALLEEFGPFRLAWMEAMIRIADWRASMKEAGDA